VSKLLLTIDVGDRTLAMEQCVVHQVAQVVAPGSVPVFLTDGFKAYTTALLTHFGHWVQLECRQAPCRSRAGRPCSRCAMRRSSK
jgi:hypothetical protein